MTDDKKTYEVARDEANESHPIDEINNRFYSPFQDMKEMYALQKGIEAGFYIGSDWSRTFTANEIFESPEMFAIEGALTVIKNTPPITHTEKLINKTAHAALTKLSELKGRFR